MNELFAFIFECLRKNRRNISNFNLVLKFFSKYSNALCFTETRTSYPFFSVNTETSLPWAFIRLKN